MSYIFNSAVLGSMFAVPSQVVDNYIKLASASQLKTLLWICRHISEPIDPAIISREIGYSVGDVEDALTVIASWGILIGTDVTLPPPPLKSRKKRSRRSTLTIYRHQSRQVSRLPQDATRIPRFSQCLPISRKCSAKRSATTAEVYFL